jgi:hypothetical protein
VVGGLNATLARGSAIVDTAGSTYGSAVGKVGSVSTRVGLATVTGGISEIPQVRNAANKVYDTLKFW